MSQIHPLENLGLVEIVPDPKTPDPIENLSRVLATPADLRFLLHCTSDQLRTHLGELAERNVFFFVSCRDHEDASQVVDLVRARSRPLG